jgi:hypothetical protein
MMGRLRPSLAGLVALLALAACKGDDTGAKAEAFCHDIIQEGCVRAFDCVPPSYQTMAFVEIYSTSVASCQAKPDKCNQYPATCPNYDRDAGATCLDDFTNQTCAQILIIQDGGDPTIALPTSCNMGALCPAQ